MTATPMTGEQAAAYQRLRACTSTATATAYAATTASVRAVHDHAVGSGPWWQAVRTAREVNEDHLSEEEADVLSPYRDRVDPARRQELGSQWVAFHREHEAARGLSGADADPYAVIGQQQ